jgi:predicted site-specific integrase-resolvase
MKLSQWAKKLGISYRTAWRMYQNGQIPNAVKLPTGSIIVLEDECENKSMVGENNTVAIYCRVLDNASKDNLERQAERLKEYARDLSIILCLITKSPVEYLQDFI